MKSLLITKTGYRIIEHAEPLPLKTLYDLLECTTIDIPSRFVGKYRLQFIVDDEGLMKDNFMTAKATDCEEFLVGNMIVTTYDEDGEQAGLTDEQAEAVTRCIASTAGLAEGVGDFVLRYKAYR